MKKHIYNFFLSKTQAVESDAQVKAAFNLALAALGLARV
jgi:hypothetical protein